MAALFQCNVQERRVGAVILQLLHRIVEDPTRLPRTLTVISLVKQSDARGDTCERCRIVVNFQKRPIHLLPYFAMKTS